MILLCIPNTYFKYYIINIYIKMDNLKNIFHLQELSIKCEDTIKQIRWKDKIIDHPCEIMQPIFLLNNLCFSFNALPYHDMYRHIPYKL